MIISKNSTFIAAMAFSFAASSPSGGVEEIPSLPWPTDFAPMVNYALAQKMPGLRQPLPLSGLFVHRVRPGDTLQKISRLYRVDSREVARINLHDSALPLRPGQELRIPEE